MTALLYLGWRSVVNGVRRSLTSPRRLIGLGFFALYYLLVFRPALGPGAAMPDRPIRIGEGLPFPPLAIVDAIVFGGFVGLSVLFIAGVTRVKGAFRAADVDVLFPTPISPKLVLGFRLLRDTLLTLIVPLLLTLIFYRPASAGWTALFRDVPSPESAGHVLRVALVAYFLLSLAWVAIGYASGLWLNRPGEHADRLRAWVTWSLAFCLVGMAGLVAWKAQAPVSLVELAHHPLIRAFWVVPSSATALTMSPLEGSWNSFLVGGGGLITLIALGLWLCARQIGWLYEEAAMRVDSTGAAHAMARRGDLYGAVANMARQGRVKSPKASWLTRLKAPGPRALLWKETILQLRGSRLMLIIQFLIIGVMFSVMPALMAMEASPRVASVFYLFMQALGMLMFVATQAQGGYIEMLRRVDLLKPLPFPPARTVRAEVLGKALFPALACLVGAVVFTALHPEGWPAALAGAMLMPTFALLLSGLFAALSVLFPDFEDPTQRGFRALVNLLGLVVLCGPGFAVFWIAWATGFPAPLAAAPVMLINLALAWVAAQVAGDLYAGFNPTE